MELSFLAMERPGDRAFTGDMNPTAPPPPTPAAAPVAVVSPETGTGPAPADVPTDLVVRAIDRRSFCTLATTSPQGRAHVAGVLYEAVGADLYVSTTRASRKARNIEANPFVAVCIPVRRLPVGPPSTVQFQGRAELVDLDDPELRRLADVGQLKRVTSHGELDLPGGCFVRITPNGRAATYGLGMSLVTFLRDPLGAAGSADLTSPPETTGSHATAVVRARPSRP